MMASIDEFLTSSGILQYRITKLGGDASVREYYRVVSSKTGKSHILCDSSKDLMAFNKTIELNKIFTKLGQNVPQILGYNQEHGYIMLQDFGDKSLKKIITPFNCKQYYMQIIDVLCDIQQKSIVNPPANLGQYSVDLLNQELMKFCNYYLKNVIKSSQYPSAVSRLMDIFNNDLYPQLEVGKNVLVHRDFHAENLIITPHNQIGIIDYQDALMGNYAYDLVCLLQDARRYISEEFEAEMKQYFLSKTGYNNVNFDKCYHILGLQKNLKIIGIFHFLSKVEGGQKYLAKCDIVWEYIRRNLSVLGELGNWFQSFRVIPTKI